MSRRRLLAIYLASAFRCRGSLALYFSTETLVAEHFGLSARGYWSLQLLRGLARLFGRVVYDVHDCFVDRHEKKKQLLLEDKHGH